MKNNEKEKEKDNINKDDNYDKLLLEKKTNKKDVEIKKLMAADNNNNKNIKKKESKSQNKDIISGINIFNNLLSNKAFRKFLNHKLINDKDNEDIPQKKFIKSLPYKENKLKNNNQENNENIHKDINSFNYSLFYNEENYLSQNYNRKSTKISNNNKNNNILYNSPRNNNNYVNNIKINFNNR